MEEATTMPNLTKPTWDTLHTAIRAMPPIATITEYDLHVAADCMATYYAAWDQAIESGATAREANVIATIATAAWLDERDSHVAVIVA